MTSNRNNDFRSIGRIANAFRYSLDGLRHAAKKEAAFQQELILLGIFSLISLLLPFALYLKIQILMAHLLILAVELLNTAIEALADKLCEETDPLIKQAKDMGSAAVLLIMAASVLLWAYALLTLI